MDSQRRIQREISCLHKTPTDSFRLSPTKESLYIWEAFIKGPEETSVANREFQFEITIPHNYPYKHPCIRFIKCADNLPFQHINIDSTGYVCMNTLSQEWLPSLSVETIVMSVFNSLTEEVPKMGMKRQSKNQGMLDTLEEQQTNPFAFLDIVSKNEIGPVRAFKVTDKDKNAESAYGLTPLIQAILNQNYDICLYLLSIGVDVNYRNKENHTALSLFINIFVEHKQPFNVLHTRIILLLLRYGADASLAHDSLKSLGYEVSGQYLCKKRFN